MFCLLRTWTWGLFSNWCFPIGPDLITSLIRQSHKPLNVNLKTYISITNNGKSMIINQLLSLLSSVRKISISPTQKLKRTLHLLVHLPSKTDSKIRSPRSVFSNFYSFSRALIWLVEPSSTNKNWENRCETIFMMRQAGIAVWMLTGDKQETAINIGFSCKLIDEHQELFSLDTDSLEVGKLGFSLFDS